MSSISLRIAYPIIIAGLFIMVAFIALNYQSLSTSFYIIFSLLIIYIFLFGFATGQNFASPLKKLLRSADNLSKGDLKSRFYSESKDELGELARVFNRIAEDLEESRGQTETMEKSVDIKVQARTRALEETINALEQKIKNRTVELEKMVQEMDKIKAQPIARKAEVTAPEVEGGEVMQEAAMPKPRKKRVKKVVEPQIAEPGEDSSINI
ncbi:MAG: HAMP domain-containing protein [bacterium]|nr:HAMP domain-containing protein [bacterium]